MYLKTTCNGAGEKIKDGVLHSKATIRRANAYLSKTY